MKRVAFWPFGSFAGTSLTSFIIFVSLLQSFANVARAGDAKSYIGKELWSPGLQIVCPTLEGWTKGAGGCFEIDRGAHLRVVDGIHTDDLLDPHNVRDYFLVAFDDGTKAFIQQRDVTSGCCYLTEPPGAEEARRLEEFTAKIKAEDAKTQADAVKAKAACEKKGGVSIGMTQLQVLASCWGRPRQQHSTTTASGTEEQWVYGGENYLYFANGILVSIQN